MLLGGIIMRVEYFIQDMIEMIDDVQRELTVLLSNLDK